MKGNLSEQKIALALGVFAGLVHLLWALVVYAGYGQMYLDFVLGLHFIENPFVVTTFDVQKAAMLVIMAFIAGSGAGWLFTKVWNKVFGKGK